MKRMLGVAGVALLALLAMSLFLPGDSEAQLGKKQYVGAAKLEGDNLYVNKMNIFTPGATVASAAGEITLPTTGTLIQVTGTAKITRILAGTQGRIVILHHATTDTLVDGVNLRLAGDFEATANDVLALCYGITGVAADTFWTELYRSAN